MNRHNIDNDGDKFDFKCGECAKTVIDLKLQNVTNMRVVDQISLLNFLLISIKNNFLKFLIYSSHRLP